jgi:hypothetical protein
VARFADSLLEDYGRTKNKEDLKKNTVENKEDTVVDFAFAGVRKKPTDQILIIEAAYYCNTCWPSFKAFAATLQQCSEGLV